MALSSMRNYSSTEMFNSSSSSSSSSLGSRILDHHFGMGLNFNDLVSQFRSFVEKNIPECRDICTTRSSSDATVSSSVTSSADKFQVKLDVQQFAADEITVKISGTNTITVEGKHEERQDDYGFVSRHFIRRYVLPEGHDITKVVSNLSSDGVLSIIAPRIGRDINEHRTVPIQQSEFGSRFFENKSNRQQETNMSQNSRVQVNQRSSNSTSDRYRMVPIQQTGVTYKKTLQQEQEYSSKYNENVNRQQQQYQQQQQQYQQQQQQQYQQQQQERYRNVPIQQTSSSRLNEYERQETRQRDEYRNVPIQQTGVSSRTMQETRTEEQYRNVPIQQTGMTAKNIHETTRTAQSNEQYRNIPIQQTGVSSQTVEEETKKKQVYSADQFKFEPSLKIKEIEEKYQDVLQDFRNVEEETQEEILRRQNEEQCRNVPIQQTSKLYEETNTKEEYTSSSTGQVPSRNQVTESSEYEKEEKRRQFDQNTAENLSRTNEYEKEVRREHSERDVAPASSINVREEYSEEEIRKNISATSALPPQPQQRITETSTKQEEFYSSSTANDERQRRSTVPGEVSTSKRTEYEERRFSDQIGSSSSKHSEYQEEKRRQQQELDSGYSVPLQQTGMSSKTTEYEEQRTTKQVGRAMPMQQQQQQSTFSSSSSFEETKKSSSKSTSSQQQQQQYQERRGTGNLTSLSEFEEENMKRNRYDHIVPASHHNQADFTSRKQSVSSCTENGITSKVSEFQKQEMTQQNGIASKSNEYKKEETVQQRGNPAPLSSKTTENKEREVRCVIQEVTDGIESVPVEYTRLASQIGENQERIVPMEIL